jgi:hypothetical protein
VHGLAETRPRVHHTLRVSLMEETTVLELIVVNGQDLRLVKPFNSLTIFPKTILHLVVLGNHICAETVLLAPIPVTFVAATISPSINTKPMFFVVFVLTLIHASIVPNVDAHALHVIL